MFKLRQLADLFCDQDGITAPEGRDNRYSRLRALSQRGIIAPDATGRGKVAHYSLADAAIARLCLSLIDAGFDAATLDGLDIAFRPKPEWNEGFRHLDAVLVSIGKGEAWVFEVDRHRNADGSLGMSGRFRREEQPAFSGEDKAAIEKFNEAQKRKREITIILHATDLLRGLLAEAEG